MANFPDLSRIEGFDWDQANIEKNWDRHNIAFYECEEVFFREPIVLEDLNHSEKEQCYFALGQTVRGRLVTVIFTVRKNKIRVISARDMSRKERKFYEES